MTEEDFLTTKQLAERLQVSTRTVRNMVKERRIPVIRMSKRDFRFDIGMVKRALEKEE